VTATDSVADLLALERRAALEHLPLTVSVADAQDLPFADASFDIVISTFGAMFARDQERTSAELFARLPLRRAVGMANWRPTASSATCSGRSSHTSRRRTACGHRLNGATSARCAKLLGPGVRIAQLQTAVSSSGASPHPSTCSTTSSGGTARPTALGEDAQEAPAHDLPAVYSRHNRAGHAAMVAPSEYLEVIAIEA
jgi:Methyltransferase domain